LHHTDLLSSLPPPSASASPPLQVVAYNKVDVPDSSDYWEDVREALAAEGVPPESCFAIRCVWGAAGRHDQGPESGRVAVRPQGRSRAGGRGGAGPVTHAVDPGLFFSVSQYLLPSLLAHLADAASPDLPLPPCVLPQRGKWARSHRAGAGGAHCAGCTAGRAGAGAGAADGGAAPRCAAGQAGQPRKDWRVQCGERLVGASRVVHQGGLWHIKVVHQGGLWCIRQRNGVVRRWLYALERPAATTLQTQPSSLGPFSGGSFEPAVQESCQLSPFCCSIPLTSSLHPLRQASQTASCLAWCAACRVPPLSALPR
jgi:hypothetical protein